MAKKSKIPERLDKIYKLHGNDKKCQFAGLLNILGITKICFVQRASQYMSTQMALLPGEVNLYKIEKMLTPAPTIGYTIRPEIKEEPGWLYVPGYIYINQSNGKVTLTRGGKPFKVEIYTAVDGVPYMATIKFTLKPCETLPGVVSIASWEISKWKEAHRYPGEFISHTAEFKEAVDEMEKKNPYAWDFWQHQEAPALGLIVPELEILKKADFKFVDLFLSNRRRLTPGDISAFNRLVQSGTKPANILKTSKGVYSTLKREGDMQVWDLYRKLDKFGRISPTQIRDCHAEHFRANDLTSMNSILSKEYDGKRIFSFDTLMNYLRKLDNFEAISRDEAFALISDYIALCETVAVKPVFTGDSLKREHDVMARIARNKRNTDAAKSFNASCGYLAENNYTEKVFSIRGVLNYDDLIDEARQQHSCLAGYAKAIEEKRSYIYLMRETAHPDESFITVELSSNPGIKKIVQMAGQYNRPVRNKAAREFLDRWLKNKVNARYL